MTLKCGGLVPLLISTEFNPKAQRQLVADQSGVKPPHSKMARYEFVTIWNFKAPQQQVWDLIFHSEDWPRWWPGVEKVERLKDGDADHIGAIHRYTWKSKLPYRLVFEMQTTYVEPISIIEGQAIGELQGIGRWQLSNDGEITTVRYDWKVETTKAWMNFLASVARPIFQWNHDVVMGWGAAALAKRLGTYNR